MSVKAKLTVTGTDVLIECRDAILQFLPGVPELWALSKCSKTLRLHYEKKEYVLFILKRNMKILLQPFHLSFDHLLSFFRIQRGTVLSGSSILQVYTGEFWESSDLDIYVPYKANRFKMHCNRIMHLVPTCEFLSIVNPTKFYNMTTHQAMVEVDRPNGKKIQFIFHETLLSSTERIGLSIVQTFDLTMLQNFFDGKRWRAKYFNHIVQRIMEFSPKACNSVIYLGIKNIIRIKKYQSRGYTFIKSFRPEHICPMAWLYVEDMYKTKEGYKFNTLTVFDNKFKLLYIYIVEHDALKLTKAGNDITQ